MKYLGKVTTTIKFSPDGNTLAIGFFNGDIIIFDWKYENNKTNPFGNKVQESASKISINAQQSANSTSEESNSLI